MPRCTLVQASLLHTGPLAHRMREADKRECVALGRTPKDALRFSLRNSLYAFTALDEAGKPLAMLGVGSTGLMTGNGKPWLLGRDEIFDHARDLLTLGPKMFAWWLETFSTLENIVSADNEKAIRLLSKWGASFDGPIVRYSGTEFITFRFARSS